MDGGSTTTGGIEEVELLVAKDRAARLSEGDEEPVALEQILTNDVNRAEASLYLNSADFRTLHGEESLRDPAHCGDR